MCGVLGSLKVLLAYVLSDVAPNTGEESEKDGNEERKPQTGGRRKKWTDSRHLWWSHEIPEGVSGRTFQNG